MKKLRLSAIIIAIGLVIAVAAHFLTSMCKMPTVTEQDFAYSVTYKLDGETKTLNGVYTCSFSRFGNNGIDPLDRYYSGEYTVDGVTTDSRTYTIAQKDGTELYIVMSFNDCYLMGDTKNDSYSESIRAPQLEAKDEEGNQYGETELPDTFDAEIVSWEYPEPIENTFVFAKFSGLHATGMAAMLLVGLLTLIACIIFVKKDETVVYCVLDKIGILLNFAVVMVALPIIFLSAWLIQAFPTGPDWIYQAYLCVPQIIPFTLAASVSLRRKGFSKIGFIIQFFGPAILIILSILEYIL